MLFRTLRICCYCIIPVTVFQGQSNILDDTISHLGTEVATLSAVVPNLLYLLKGQLLGLISKLGHQLPDCQGVSMPYELGCGKQ